MSEAGGDIAGPTPLRSSDRYDVKGSVELIKGRLRCDDDGRPYECRGTSDWNREIDDGNLTRAHVPPL